MDFVPLQWIDPLSNFLYTYVLIYLLVGAGIYFTIKTKGVQVRYFGRMIKQIFKSRSDSEGGISSFQAFAVGLASRVGTCLLYTSPSPRDRTSSRMPSSS